MTPITFGQIVDEVLDAVRARNSKEQRAIIEKVINREYMSIYRRYSWEMGRQDPLDVDFTSSKYSSGMWVPSDLAGIDMVWDDTNNIEFIPRNAQEAKIDEYGYRYYVRRGSKTPLFYGEDGQFDRNASQFSSASLASEISTGTIDTVSGEYVSIYSENGYYKIISGSNPFVIEPSFRFQDKTSESFSVRPSETMKLVLIGEDEDELQDRTVKLYYWAYPEPLILDNDRVMLPTSDCLALSVISKLPEAKSHRPISQAQVDGAIDDAIRLNGDFPRSKSFRTVSGKKMDWSLGFYSQRGSGISPAKTLRF